MTLYTPLFEATFQQQWPLSNYNFMFPKKSLTTTKFFVGFIKHSEPEFTRLWVLEIVYIQTCRNSCKLAIVWSRSVAPYLPEVFRLICLLLMVVNIAWCQVIGFVLSRSIM